MRISGFIVLYQFLKVNYESKVTWHTATDYLRCNPHFYGSPRFDHVLVNSNGHSFFAQLITMLKCTVENRDYFIALIHPFDMNVDSSSIKDSDLGFYRTLPKPQAHCIFVFISSIVRGALLVQDWEGSEDMLVVDVVDTDMFLRMKTL